MRQAETRRHQRDTHMGGASCTATPHAAIPPSILGVVIAVLFLTASACNNGPPTDVIVAPNPYPPPYSWTTATPEEQSIDADTLSAALLELQALPYVESFVLVRNGYLVAEQYALLERKFTHASVASVSKSFTSALVGIALRERFLDSLGQRVFDFFPEYATPGMDPRKRNITIEHLLTMRSGLNDLESNDHSAMLNNTTNWIGQILALPLNADPGSQFNYLSINTHLISGVLTRASGMSTMSIAQQHLLQPLGITVLVWPHDPQGYYFGGSGLSFYPRDLALLGYLYACQGWFNGQQIVPAEWVRISTQPHDDRVRTWGALTNVRYGYHWWTAQWQADSLFLAVGFGGQFVVVVPRLKLVAVVTSNLYCTDAEADVRHFAILDILSRHVLSAAK
jgi:CubicO group peptidase (beta-lactamase class C family)